MCLLLLVAGLLWLLLPLLLLLLPPLLMLSCLLLQPPRSLLLPVRSVWTPRKLLRGTAVDVVTVCDGTRVPAALMGMLLLWLGLLRLLLQPGTSVGVNGRLLQLPTKQCLLFVW